MSRWSQFVILDLAHPMTLPKGNLVVFDRGYTDYAWYTRLIYQDVYFVTRQLKNACYRVIARQPLTAGSSVTSGSGDPADRVKAERCPGPLRLSRSRDRQVLRLYHQQYPSGGQDDRGDLQGMLADRAVLQIMDQREYLHV